MEEGTFRSSVPTRQPGLDPTRGLVRAAGLGSSWPKRGLSARSLLGWLFEAQENTTKVQKLANTYMCYNLRLRIWDRRSHPGQGSFGFGKRKFKTKLCYGPAGAIDERPGSALQRPGMWSPEAGLWGHVLSVALSKDPSREIGAVSVGYHGSSSSPASSARHLGLGILVS